MASAEDTTVAAPPSQKKSKRQATREGKTGMCVPITVNIHNRMWTEGTYCPSLQADSSRVECNTFPDKSEGLSRWVGGAFIVATHSSWFIVRYVRKITERTYISGKLPSILPEQHSDPLPVQIPLLCNTGLPYHNRRYGRRRKHSRRSPRLMEFDMSMGAIRPMRDHG
jgi:hypothetical protein